MSVRFDDPQGPRQDDVLNEIDRDEARFFRHPRFRDTLMLRASFTRHRYELHSHPTYVIAVVTRGVERLRVGAGRHVAPRGLDHPRQSGGAA